MPSSSGQRVIVAIVILVLIAIAVVGLSYEARGWAWFEMERQTRMRKDELTRQLIDAIKNWRLFPRRRPNNTPHCPYREVIDAGKISL